MGGMDIIDGNISKGTYYEVSTYTIVGDTAYESSNDAIRIDGLTRITIVTSVKYQDGTLDIYLLYSYGVVVAIIDQTGYDSIVDNLNLTELPSYTINRNEATPVGGLGNDLVDTSLFYKVRILPNITLDGTPTTMYMCLDISNNVIVLAFIPFSNFGDKSLIGDDFAFSFSFFVIGNESIYSLKLSVFLQIAFSLLTLIFNNIAVFCICVSSLSSHILL